MGATRLLNDTGRELIFPLCAGLPTAHPRRPQVSSWNISVSGLNDSQWIGRHPDIELLESRLKPFLEFDKELQVLVRIGNVTKHADQFIAIELALMSPATFNKLRFR